MNCALASSLTYDTNLLISNSVDLFLGLNPFKNATNCLLILISFIDLKNFNVLLISPITSI